MDHSVIMIFTNSAIYKKAKEVVEKQEEKIPVYNVKLKNAVEFAKKRIAEGVKVIISRGGVGMRLREELDCPVVMIKYTYFDFAGAIQKAKAYDERVAIVTFDQAIESAKKVKGLLGEKIALVRISHSDNLDKVIKKLVDEGYKILIGGNTVAGITVKYNIRTIMIEADEESVQESIEEAKHYLRISHERELRFQTVNSIINCVSEGIIGIDKNGRINNINAVAMKLFQEVMDENDYYSVVGVEPLACLLNTAKTGESHFEELVDVGKQSLVINSVPIKVGDELIGAVGTIQEINQIQKIENKVRKRMMLRGYVARKNFDDIIGCSKSILEVKEKAMNYARVDSTVMILGETGTGKEIFAQSIHNASQRMDEPFVAINCAALPQSLLESELFGYARGAFTGARSEGKAGIFEIAHKGTIFLDEISEMPIGVQSRLLRVIQEKEFTRVGDDRVIPIDVRIITASNKNLMQEVEAGNFRPDLYYRLCVLILCIPAIRDRKGDISILAKHLVKKISRTYGKNVREITPEAIEILEQLEYPGNIRQLSNIIERSVIISRKQYIDVQTIQESLEDDQLKVFQSCKTFVKGEDDEDIEDKENQKILDTLARCNGNKSEAARQLGIGRSTLWRKLRKLNYNK